MSATFWAYLASVGSINLEEKDIAFPADPLQYPAELPKAGIQHLLPEESLSPGDAVKVFYKDHPCPITEPMGKLVEKILAAISYVFV